MAEYLVPAGNPERQGLIVGTGSAQPDISIPAHATVDAYVTDGWPETELFLDVHELFEGIPMPPGPQGADGPPGRPRATFVKMGAIANAAARPAVLGAGARGWWWHRLDTNGMDVWCGDHWAHSPNAVGVAGPAAPGNTLAALPVIRDETYTMAAVKMRGRTANQTIEYTAPAGARGARGVAGNVFGSAITEAPDYDDTNGPVQGSMFAYSRVMSRFRPLSRPPTGYGPYHFGASSFTGPVNIPSYMDNAFLSGNRQVAAVTLPAMPFPWRPLVWGMLRTSQVPQGNIFTIKRDALRVTVRLNEYMNGPKVAQFTNPFFAPLITTVNTEIDGALIPFWGDTQSLRTNSSSGYGVVSAYETATFVVAVEVVPGSFWNYGTSGAFLDIWALPVTASMSGISSSRDNVSNYPED